MWVETEERLKLCRQYSTQEPCTCLHFTQVSLIVGAEKFYEIDLKTFEIDGGFTFMFKMCIDYTVLYNYGITFV